MLSGLVAIIKCYVSFPYKSLVTGRRGSFMLAASHLSALCKEPKTNWNSSRWCMAERQISGSSDFLYRGGSCGKCSQHSLMSPFGRGKPQDTSQHTNIKFAVSFIHLQSFAIHCIRSPYKFFTSYLAQ